MQPTPSTIIVRMVEAPVRETTLADVIIGALGLTGALLLAAALFGGILGALMVARRVLRARHGIPDDGTQTLGLTEAR